jgi:hypothetical protein
MRDYQGSQEFQDWWNAKFDPDETGRTRIVAALAFDAGMAARHSPSRCSQPLPVTQTYLDDACGPLVTDGVGKATRN